MTGLQTTGVVVGSAAVLIGGYFAYRYFIPPSFEIISYNPTDHTGTYMWNGNQSQYGNGAVVQGAYSGWELNVKMNPDQSTTFELWQNGKFIKQLDTSTNFAGQ
jgi:hypothetical protein